MKKILSKIKLIFCYTMSLFSSSMCFGCGSDHFYVQYDPKFWKGAPVACSGVYLCFDCNQKLSDEVFYTDVITRYREQEDERKRYAETFKSIFSNKKLVF